MYIHVMFDSSLLETPDLIFALPLAPDDHMRVWDGITIAGEIDVELGYPTVPSILNPPLRGKVGVFD